MNAWWSETMVQGVGWTLLHFLWQGLVIAALLAGVLRLLRNGPAQYRYLASCAALLLMALAPLVTFQLVLKPDEPPPLPVVEPAPEFTPAPVERTVTPAMAKPKIVVTATRELRAQKVSWRLEPLLPWLVAAWLAGVCGLSCRLFAGWLQVRRLRRADAETVADGWPEKLAELARRLGVDRPLRLLRTARVEVPTVIGWLRPVILLPAACLAGLTPAQLEAVLAHELAHIRRHDYLINLLQSAVETLLFYHPAVWWVSRRMREERENCCDDLVVEVCGDRVGYARALATLEELRPAPAQLALAAGGAPLLQRIRRLLGQGERSAGRPAWPLAGLLVVALLAVAGLEWRGHRANAAVNNPAAPVVQHKTATATNDPNAELRNILTDVAGAGTNAGTDWVHLDPWGNPYIVTLDKAGERIYLVDSKGHTTTDTNAGNWTLAILDTNTGKWVQEFSNAPVSVQLSSKSTEARVNTLIEDGKFYYEAGQYDEAEARFKLALKLQPDNVAASQYTKLIVEKRAEKMVRDNRLNYRLDSTSGPIQTWNVAAQAASQSNSARMATTEPNTNQEAGLKPLEIRTFLVHTNVFLEGLESARAFTLTPEGERVVQQGTTGTNKNAPVEEQIRELFRKAGVGLDGDSRKVVIWNENRGTLTVRATPEDLDLIQAVVISLNQAVPEVNIKAKFVEITSRDGDRDVGFQWYLGGFKIGDAATNNGGNPAAANTMTTNYSTNQEFVNQVKDPKVATMTGILTDPQFRAVLQALDQRDGVDVLTAPEVTTESGRQAQVQAVDIQSIVVNTNTDPLQNTNLSVKEMHFGPTLDVIPYISADEFSIQMTLIPSVTEFLGYDDPRKFVPPVKHPDGSITVLPLPHFRLRQVVTSVTVWDGQTVVIGGFAPVDSTEKTTDKVPVLGGIPLVGGLFRSEHVTKTKKNLMVFITPTIINPDGTRYHKDEDIPFARSSIPPQTGTNSTPKK